MKLKVLVDNNAYGGEKDKAEQGLSYYIEDEGTKVLLDMGKSDLFLRNASEFGIDLFSVDVVVISHGHSDHTKGLKYYFEDNLNEKVSLIAHPDAFKVKILGKQDISSPILEEELKTKCNLVLTKKPKKVSENITFLGEIPDLMDFEPRIPMGKQTDNGEVSDDYVMDDSALVYKSENGIYVITGCAHSGVCNIIEYAKQVTGEDRVLGLIGGTHLFRVNEQINRTIEYLKENNIKELYPCHCTSVAVKAEINKSIKVKEVGVGLEINW